MFYSACLGFLVSYLNEKRFDLSSILCIMFISFIDKMKFRKYTREVHYKPNVQLKPFSSFSFINTAGLLYYI